MDAQILPQHSVQPRLDVDSTLECPVYPQIFYSTEIRPFPNSILLKNWIPTRPIS